MEEEIKMIKSSKLVIFSMLSGLFLIFFSLIINQLTGISLISNEIILSPATTSIYYFFIGFSVVFLTNFLFIQNEI